MPDTIISRKTATYKVAVFVFVTAIVSTISALTGTSTASAQISEIFSAPQTTQMITVSTSSSSATTGTLTAWQKVGSTWQVAIGPVNANVGSAGIGNASEGSSKTPAGVWGLSQGFGRQTNPGSKIPYFQTDSNDWWDSNVNSPTYNSHVRQVNSPGGPSENLFKVGAPYDYAVVMDYNTARMPGAGSAFFLHVSDGTPTGGCVSTDQNTVVQILRWLDPAQSPVINIGVNVAPPTNDPPPPSLPGRDSPEGAFVASVRSDGWVDVNGWAFDGSNLLAGLDVYLYTNGQASLAVNASGPRPELAGYGIVGNHGFVGSFPAPTTGNNQICMYVRNVGAGSDQLVQCINLNYPANPTRDNPRGALSATVTADGIISVSGWGFDPNNMYAPVNVMVTVAEKSVSVVTANAPRPDLAQFGVPGNHGFTTRFPAPTTGDQSICLYVANLGYGTGQWAQCLTLTYAPDPATINPQAAFTSSKTGSNITVNGWAFDPSNFYTPVTIMITVNGEVRTFASAQSARPELANFGVPGNHGFTTTIPAGTTPDQVCIFAFNIGYGTNQLIGCQTT